MCVSRDSIVDFSYLPWESFLLLTCYALEPYVLVFITLIFSCSTCRFDTEPVPLSTYREAEPDPFHATQQEKDDFWSNGFNREEPESFQAKENGKRSVDHNSSFTHGETDLNQLPAIAQFSTGQGLPYAPVDWPSPGDVWTWRVGRRVTATGFHQDRFLILPQRLQQKNVPKSFASKPTLAR